MKFSLFIKTTTLLLIFLVSCQTGTPTTIPSPTATVTTTPSPIPTLTPTPDPEIISPENASQLVLKFMNMGTAIGEPTYSPDGKWLYQESTVGMYAFDTASYQDVHLLASSPVGTPSPSTLKVSELELLPEYAIQPEARETIFSPDASLIAGYFHPDFVAVWRLTDGKLINRFDGRPKEISVDNRLITVGWSVPGKEYDESYMGLYDLQTGEQLGSWHSIRAFFLSDSRLAVEADGYTRIFDPRTRKAPHVFAGQDAAISPDEQNVAVLYGNRIHIYRISDGKLLHNLDGGLPSTDKAILRFSADGQILAGYTIEYYCCSGWGARFFLWRVADGSLMIDLSRETGPRFGPHFSLSPDGGTIAIGSQVLRTSDGSLIADLETDFIHAVTNLAFTPDMQQIIVLDAYEHLYLYPVDGGMLSSPQDADKKTYLPFLQPASGSNSDDLIDVPSPDGKFLARRDKSVVTIWNTSVEGEVFNFPLYRVRCLTFSPDGRILVLGLADGSAELWEVYGKQKIYTIHPRTSGNSYSVGGLAFSSDGKLLAVGLWDGTVRLYGINAK